MITPQDWRAKGHNTTLLGRNIFYVDSGEGEAGAPKETIVLIHGFPTSSWDWVKIWEPLSRQYRLIALDMLGFGFSDKPDPHSYSIHEQANIVEALAGHLQLTQFHVLAHDYGDTVAQELLARQNDRSGIGDWKSVCFLNGGLFPETHKALLIQKLLLSPLGPLINTLTTRRRFDVSMARVFGAQSQPAKHELDGFWDLINHNYGRHIFHNLITYMKDRITHRERWVAALREAAVPIALINGSDDPVSGRHMIAHYKTIISNPHYLAELPGIGHYPQVEAPDAVASHYLAFLETCG